MAIVAKWTDETKTVMCLTFCDGWTWEEFAKTTVMAAETAALVEHPVDFIYAFEGMAVLPPGALDYMKASARRLSNAETIFVLVGASPAWRAVTTALARLYPRSIHLVYHANSLAEAELIVESRRRIREMKARALFETQPYSGDAIVTTGAAR